MVTEDVCLTGTHNTLVRLTSTCGRWKEEASRNGEWKQFVADGQFGASWQGAEGVWILTMRKVLCFGAGVGKVREEPRGQGLCNASGDASLEVVD